MATDAAALPDVVCDPHFHFWDSVARPNPNLGGIVDTIPAYLASDYAADVARVHVKAAVHVETIVGQMDGGAKLDEVGETRFLAEETKKLHMPTAIVGYVHLARDDVAAVLDAHQEAGGASFVGVRMILNYKDDDPTLCWPQVGRGDWMRTPEFRRGFAELSRRGLTFDLQCNPHQLADMAELLRDFPTTTVVINHLAVPRLRANYALRDEEDDAAARAADAALLRVWRAGLASLSAFPRVFVKASMLAFVLKDWESNAASRAVVTSLVRDVIGMFGAQRVMFASNFPVDKFTGSDIAALYDHFCAIAAVYTAGERAALFHDSAVNAYGLERLAA